MSHRWRSNVMLGRWTTFVALFALLISMGQQLVLAQDATPQSAQIATIESQSTVELDFPRGITINSQLSWDIDAEDAVLQLLFHVAGDPTSNLASSTMKSFDGAGTMEIGATIDLQSQFVPSGVDVQYYWRLVGPNGVIAQSAPESTLWFDNRWDWQSVESDQVRVHYYDLDESFASEILKSAQQTVTDLESRYKLDRSEMLQVWVYPSLDDFREAQQPNSRESIAGASYPGYFLIVAVIPDGNTAEIGRVIPHEISHQVLFQATENPFTYPPLWFDEGLATHYQVGGTDGYLEMVIRAYDNDELFNLQSLAASFPFLPAQATMAYATGWSAIEYIEETYGDTGIAALIDAFAQGISYDEAITNALGIDGDQLNTDWRAWVAAQAD